MQNTDKSIFCIFIIYVHPTPPLCWCLLHHLRRCRHAATSKRGGRLVAVGRVEPFVGSLFPWHNCHGGAWNKALLVTHTVTRVRHWMRPAARRAGREIWLQKARNIQEYPWIYHVYTMYIHHMIWYHVYPCQRTSRNRTQMKMLHSIPDNSIDSDVPSGASTRLSLRPLK